MPEQPISVVAHGGISLDEIFGRTPTTPSVVVVDGYGVKVSVTAGRLVLTDGIGEQRRTVKLSRSQRTVKRIVVLGKSGSITLDAFRWCSDVGIALVAVDADMTQLLTYSTPNRHDDARLRRAQAFAQVDGTGTMLAKHLVAEKLAGQSRVATQVLGQPEVAALIDVQIEALQSATDPHRCLLIEARGAAAYFSAWKGLNLSFGARDASKIPQAWTDYRQRASELAGWTSARSATHPINAILNYCYRLAEIEATLACHTLGLDPGMGILHVDKAYRGSLALDLIEAIRPNIDAYVLDLVGSHTFRRADFHETRDGRCRVLAPLTHTLAETMPQWAHAIAPHAETIAHAFAENTPGSTRRTPLTGKPRTSQRRPAKPPRVARPTPACPNCGNPLGDRRRALCPACFEANRLPVARDRAAATAKRLAELHILDQDPATRPTSNELRSAKVSASRTANDLWDLENPDAIRDIEHFRTQILPGIVAVPIQVIGERLGVVQDAAWRIREGRLTPHPRHWESLRGLAES